MLAVNRKTIIEQQLARLPSQAMADALHQILSQQHFAGKLSAQAVDTLCKKFQLSTDQLALQLLPIAAGYAATPISHFHVGAVVQGNSGTFYFGGNQEFSGVAIQQTIHAEQSAISHAWLHHETSIRAISVNYTPCGHCRQFMNELNCSEQLYIHLPQRQNNRLSQYLPNAFGPKDLNIQQCLFDPHDNRLQIDQDTPLAQAALLAANLSHAPYSLAYCGVALRLTDDTIISGRYAENAAFNPSLPALQVAINYLRLSGYQDQEIVEAAMVEAVTAMQQREMAELLLASINPRLKLQYYPARTA